MKYPWFLDIMRLILWGLWGYLIATFRGSTLPSEWALFVVAGMVWLTANYVLRDVVGDAWKALSRKPRTKYGERYGPIVSNSVGCSRMGYSQRPGLISEQRLSVLWP